MKLRWLVMAATAALQCAVASAAGLYQCADGHGGIAYRFEPCGSGPSAPVSIDRASTESLRIAPVAPQPGASGSHRSSLQERERTEGSRNTRERNPARPRVQPAPPPLAGRNDTGIGAQPRSPLATRPRGTQGPLVAPSETEPVGAPPARSVADPFTGRVLAPAGSDGVVDPTSGALWMRAGRVYVDPVNGRVIPAP